MKRLTSLSAVVPVYNSEESLQLLCDELSAVLPDVSDAWEILLVNDGSTDGSWSIIRDLSSREPHVRGINLWRNFGQHPALLCGIRRARSEFVVTLDDDLQYHPKDIPKLVDAMVDGVDVVYGSSSHTEHGLWRRVASRVLRWGLEMAVGVGVARSASPFRLFRTSIRDGFQAYAGPHVSLEVLLAWSARGFAVVEVEHQERRFGKSQYTVAKLFGHAFDLITGFSPRPLQFASFIGLVFTLIGVLVLVYVVGRFFLEGGSVPGFPFLASLIAIFSGVQLFTLGIFGQYLGRVHQRSLDRPTYVVREDTLQD